jgi:predicted ribosome quality control (RQC) complex YloA/Tae2 family protein
MTKTSLRKAETSSGKILLAGKDEKSNEELVKQAKENEYVLHTAKPGSPFVNIKSIAKDVSKQDIKEAAIFCAKYSQAYKKARIKKDVEIHIFLKKDIYKSKLMKTGTFGVRKHKKIIAKRDEII